MENNSLQKAQQWASSISIDQDSKAEIQKLIDENNLKEIEERFYRDLEFGTGGMRSILGQGTNRMNKYNIRKATQAVSSAILDTKPSSPKVAISYDSRRFSFEFAKEAATVFAANGIKALIYNRLNPVPLCSFAIRHHGCSAGVMVTASHNPPEYNGFKVFWSDGAQVTPPHDRNIINHFNSISDYGSIKFMDFEEGLSNGSIEWLDEKTENAYYEAIKVKAVNYDLCQERGSELKIIYTALHGTGLVPCTRALNDLGLTNIHLVDEQAQPDGDFPTVSSPNPENAEALELAVKLMDKVDGDIALGTDPDTDRVGIAFRHNGEIIYLNGNQIGVLMLHYILSNHKEKGTLPTNPYFVKTIVTTPLQEKIAKAFNVEVENTLTGFKWICGRMNEIEKESPERNFLFATEESFGYLNHENVRDKDGVSSITLISEIALYYKTKGMNLYQALDKIYEEYGFSHESLLSLNFLGKEGAEKIARIMEQFRNSDMKELCGLKLEKKEDYQEQVSTHCATGDSSKIELPKSNVLGYYFENNNRLFLRPSGTEPKIKFYVMIQESEGSLKEKKEKAEKKTKEILKFIEEQAQKA
tara:strand:- start:99602 stop:101359 length:1758 start_codon:yes stop_codon:yes gene_type:complete